MKNPFWLAIILATSGVIGPTPLLSKADAQTFPYDIQLDVIHQGFDQQTCWVHPRAGVIPGPNPIGVLTMQKLWLKGSDVFFALNEMRTEDLKHWSEPKSHDATLGRRNESNDVVVCVILPCAMTGRVI